MMRLSIAALHQVDGRKEAEVAVIARERLLDCPLTVMWVRTKRSLKRNP